MNLLINSATTLRNTDPSQTGLSGSYVLNDGEKVIASVELVRWRWQCDHALTLVNFKSESKESGQTLLAKIEKIAQDRGIIRIDFDTKNKETKELFEEMGYIVEVTKRSPYADSNEFIMGKIIAQAVNIPFFNIETPIQRGKESRTITPLTPPSPDFTFRKAKPGEFQTIKEIYRAPEAAPYLYGNTDDDFVVLYNERAAPKDGINGLYVLEKDGQTVATANLSKFSSLGGDVVYIGGLAVKQNIGKGIGEELLKKIEEIAINNGIIRLELEVEADNPRALGLYSKMGFEIEGGKRGYVKRPHQDYYVTEMFMAKLLHSMNNLSIFQ